MTDSVECIQRLFRTARVRELESVRHYGPITQRNPRSRQMSTPPPIIPPPPPPGGPIDSSALPASQWSNKSFDFVADATKQLIAVATGVITVTVLFSKDLNVISRCFAFGAWSVLLISVLFGILTLLNMSGELHTLAKDAYGGGVLKEMVKGASSNSGEDLRKERGIYEEGTRRASKNQIATFLLGMFLMLIFGALAVGGRPSHAKDQSAPQNITVTCVTQTPTAAPPPPKDDGQKNNSGNRKKRNTGDHKSSLVCPPCN